MGKLQKLPELSELIQLGENTSFIDSKPLFEQVKIYGEGEIKKEIITAIDKCAYSLGLEVEANRMILICEDIMEVYRHDSFEDIIYCLKKGRQGEYGQNYGKLNMIVIREWMSKHLEEKARLREQQFQSKEKHDWKDRQAYEEAVKAGDLLKQKLENLKQDDEGYQKFKAKYENEKISKRVRQNGMEKGKGK